jgi:formylglycine-generating enzyme required for sulfatase activity
MIANCFVLFFSLLFQPVSDTSFAPYEQTIQGTNVSFKMMPVAGGDFVMGNKADAGVKVSVDSFWIEEHEVTYDEYILFADEQADKEPKPDAITRPSPPYVDFTLGMGKAGGFPANSMSQYAALMYCKWLYEKTGVFYRLPTEAEWEYAARAGSQTTYFFGNDEKQLGDYAWYAANSDNKYHKVKQKKPNAWGLYDMLGNVAEWTLDQYKENYFEEIKAGANNPWMKPAKKHPITLKGGTFRDEANKLECSARLKSDLKWNARDPQIPKSKWWNADAPFIGFRIIRPVKQPSPEEAKQFFTQLLSLK